MKKEINALTKLFFLGIICVLTFSVCKKDVKKVDNLNLDKTSVKLWYLENRGGGARIIRSNTGHNILLRQNPQWEESKIYTQNGESIMIVPLKTNISSTTNIKTKTFIIVKIEDHQYVSSMINYIGKNADLDITDKDLFKRSKEISLERTGRSQISNAANWKSQLNFSLDRNSNLRLGSEVSVKNEDIPTTNSCWQWTLTTYYFRNGELIDIEVLDLGITCSGGGGVNPVTDEETDPGSPNEPDSPTITVNNVTNPCINSALTLAINSGGPNQIKDLLNPLLNSGTNVQITFDDAPFTDNKVAAFSSVGNWSNKQYDIVFNSNNMPNSSSEYNVATIYHELLHVYLFDLFGQPQPGVSLNINQHNYIADNYLGMLTSTLMSIFPSMTVTDAINLSWGGLEGTSAYDLLPLSRKAEINQTNSNYNNKTNSTGTKKGTYCP